MMHAFTNSPNIHDAVDTAWLASALEDLRCSYEMVGRGLDLFTSRETDSNEIFALSEEIEIGLICLFCALESELPTHRKPTPRELRETAERMDDAALWLREMILRLKTEHDHPTLANQLELLAEQCRDISHGLRWRWLCVVAGLREASAAQREPLRVSDEMLATS